MSINAVPTQLSEDDDVFTCALCASTLKDPILLRCLHSACRSCSDTTARITCPVCHVVTENSAAANNLLISSLVQHATALKKVFLCTNCTVQTHSVVWCYACQRSLCVDCEGSHNQYNSAHQTIPLSEHTILSELYRPPSRNCTNHENHGEELRLLCFTCQDGRCSKCAHDCYTSGHSVQPLGSPEAAHIMNDAITQAVRVLSDIKSSTVLLQAHLNLPERVAMARKDSLAMLESTMKRAVHSVSVAYENAEKSLVECWDELAMNSLSLRKSAESLMKRLDWTNRYCELTLNTKDTAGLLPQLDTVSAALRSLLEEVKLVKEPMDPQKLVSINVCLPCDVDLVTSSWFGNAKLLSDDFQCTAEAFPADCSSDYHSMRVLALQELEQLLKQQKDQHERREHERRTMEQLRGELNLKTLLLSSAQDKLVQLQEEQTLQQELNDVQCNTMEQLQEKLRSKELQLDTTENTVKQLLGKQNELQEQLESAHGTLIQLQADLTSKTQQLAPLTPLFFFNVPRDTFKGPSQCWDVAVTPKGSLLVAAMVEGLKEYDAKDFRVITAWKPTPDVLGIGFWSTAFGKSTIHCVRTVDALTDGKAVVGLDSRLIVLLHRAIGCNGRSGEWHVERRVLELAGPPRQLSVWGDQLLVALEDRYDQSTKSWLCGPSLVLLSMTANASSRNLHRQKLDYNARSVELTDRAVVVASENEVEVVETAGSIGPKRKGYVVDCYSHLGARLWRHVSSAHQVTGVCSDLVGRVLYAAMHGLVVALSVDDGRELGKAIRLFTKETERPYAVGMDRTTRQLLALITFDGDKANLISVFPVLT